MQPPTSLGSPHLRPWPDAYGKSWAWPTQQSDDAQRAQAGAGDYGDRFGPSNEAWQAVNGTTPRPIRAAGAERLVLDRQCLDDEALLACEVERLVEAIDRLVQLAL